MMKICVQLLILVMLAYPAGGYSQDEPAKVQGRISTLWGEPIEGAEVSFYQLEGIRGISPTEKLVRTTRTDKQGAYRIDDLPWGQYRVNVASLGWGHTEVWRFYLWRGASRVLDMGIPIGYEHSLAQITLSGLIQQVDKTPVEEVTVKLINAFENRESQQVRTDKAGRFEFDLIQPGQYVVYAAKPGYLVSSASVDLGNGSKEALNLILKNGQPKYVKMRQH